MNVVESIRYILVPFLVITGITSAGVFYSKKKFGSILPFVLVFCPMLLYISQFVLNSFKCGFYFLIVLSVYGNCLLIKNRGNDEYIERFFSLGFVTMIIIYIAFLIYDYKSYFNAYDEFSHWGWFVRDCYQRDSFYTTNTITSFAHKEYPPFFTLFELFWSYCVGAFSEAGVKLSVHFFEFSIIFPYFAEKLKKTGFVKMSMLVGTIFLMAICFDGHMIFNSIYVDYPVSFFLAYLLIFVYLEDGKWLLCDTCFMLFSFTITKQVSIALALIITFLYLLKNKDIKGTLLLVFVCLTSYLLWSKYAGIYIQGGQFDLKNILDIDLSQIDVVKHYINSLFTFEITNGLVAGSCFSLLLFLFVVLFIMKRTDNNAGLLSITIFVGSLGYFVMMLMLYLTCFTGWEREQLASFDRYMGCFIFALYLAVTLIIFDRKKEINIIDVSKVLICVVLSLSLKCLLNNAPKFLITLSSSHYYREAAQIIENENEKSNQKIGVISNNYGQLVINYYLDGQFSDKVVFNPDDDNGFSLIFKQNPYE